MGNKDFGGHITMRLSTGELFSLRGTLNMNTAGQSNEAVTNQDGSVDRVATVQPKRAEISFADRGVDYDALMKADRFNVTVEEDFTGVSHYFTGAFVVGDPQVNRMNGEVTGLSIAAEKYNRSNG
ncbi:phage tail tube protein [Rhizobiaceae bacterium n13]|uniref:phage tail tube protein n=1 Tax=Ferirhizobium litorale TaxID=2927786 RepID=UPI0024B2FCCB|nr:phage tail tube protein [Fererhizobium litorale]MDI7864298.1 phage tail tube protein [Fererhizobium litorale]